MTYFLTLFFTFILLAGFSILLALSALIGTLFFMGVLYLIYKLWNAVHYFIRKIV